MRVKWMREERTEGAIERMTDYDFSCKTPRSATVSRRFSCTIEKYVGKFANNLNLQINCTFIVSMCVFSRGTNHLS